MKVNKPFISFFKCGGSYCDVHDEMNQELLEILYQVICSWGKFTEKRLKPYVMLVSKSKGTAFYTLAESTCI
jgi:hypothetical protein